MDIWGTYTILKRSKQTELKETETMQETEEKKPIYNSNPQKDKMWHPWNKKRIFFEKE